MSSGNNADLGRTGLKVCSTQPRTHSRNSEGDDGNCWYIIVHSNPSLTRAVIVVAGRDPAPLVEGLWYATTIEDEGKHAITLLLSYSRHKIIVIIIINHFAYCVAKYNICLCRQAPVGLAGLGWAEAPHNLDICKLHKKSQRSHGPSSVYMHRESQDLDAYILTQVVTDKAAIKSPSLSRVFLCFGRGNQ
jgi:hypothetical protein